MVYNKTQTDQNMLPNEKKILSENETTEKTRKCW